MTKITPTEVTNFGVQFDTASDESHHRHRMGQYLEPVESIGEFIPTFDATYSRRKSSSTVHGGTNHDAVGLGEITMMAGRDIFGAYSDFPEDHDTAARSAYEAGVSYGDLSSTKFVSDTLGSGVFGGGAFGADGLGSGAIEIGAIGGGAVGSRVTEGGAIGGTIIGSSGIADGMIGGGVLGGDAFRGDAFGGEAAWMSGTTMLPLSSYKVQDDPNPTIIKRTLRPGYGGTPAVHRQNIMVRFLRPPPLRPPGPLIIKEERPPQPKPAPPLIVRQRPPVSRPLPPLILREKPPRMPPRMRTQVVVKRLPPFPAPPRQVIIERYPPLPPKPRDIVIERWLQYGPLPKRKVIYQRASQGRFYRTPKNMIIQYTSPRPQTQRHFRRLGVVNMNPAAYSQAYGTSLLDSHSLVSAARSAGVIENIGPPAGQIPGAGIDFGSAIESSADSASSTYRFADYGFAGYGVGGYGSGRYGTAGYSSGGYSSNGYGLTNYDLISYGSAISHGAGSVSFSMGAAQIYGYQNLTAADIAYIKGLLIKHGYSRAERAGLAFYGTTAPGLQFAGGVSSPYGYGNSALSDDYIRGGFGVGFEGSSLNRMQTTALVTQTEMNRAIATDGNASYESTSAATEIAA